MIRNLVRAAAALPLGAFALAALPLDIAAAAVPSSVDITITHSCNGNDWDFMWLLHAENDSPSSIVLKFIDEAGESHSATVQAGNQHEMVLYGDEGLPASVQVLVDNVVTETDSVALVDCHPDGEPTASIDLVCPAEGSQEDIAVEYFMQIEDAAIELEWRGPDGSTSLQVVADGIYETASKVFEGDVIDVWVKRTDTNEVLASLQTTVDCTPDAEPQQVEDEPGSEQASEGTLPATGGSAALAWMALGTTVLGAAALGFAQRRPMIAVDESGK